MARCEIRSEWCGQFAGWTVETPDEVFTVCDDHISWVAFSDGQPNTLTALDPEGTDQGSTR